MDFFNIYDYYKEKEDILNKKEITGYFQNIIFKDYKTGLTAFSLSVDDKKVVCLGKIQDLENIYNIPITLQGGFTKHKKHGNQFVFQKYKLECKDKASIIALLKSGLVKGMNYKTAERLSTLVVENKIENLLDYFENSSLYDELCFKIPSFEKYKIEIVQKISKIVAFKKLFELILDAGGDYHNVTKLINKYENPYQYLKDHVYTVGLFSDLSFKSCEYIAKYFGYSPYDKRRACGFINYALTSSENNGHTYIPLDMLAIKIEKMQKHNCYYPIVPFAYIMSFIIENPRYHYSISPDGVVRISFMTTFKREIILTSNIKRIQSSRIPLPFKEEYIHDVEDEINLSYAQGQKTAFNAAKTTGVKIVTGGPGTGKTTWVNGFIRIYKKMYPDNIIKLCSPTGRAAQRLAESTGCVAETFHRFLEYKPYDGGICKYSSNNYYECDCLIIDEMSMADLEMTNFILDALKNEILLIILGDVDQLPSVGCGNILQDLIASQKVEVYTLETLFRQSLESSIVSNALKINKYDDNLTLDEHFKINIVNDELIAMSCLDDYINDDCQIFSPTKKGFLGTKTINQYIQYLVHKQTNIEHLTYGVYNFCLNDKIMVVKNNYDKNYFNGEVGRITYLNSRGLEITFDKDRTVVLSTHQLDEIVLAYAITIHKSQGSEYKNIVIVLPEDADCLLSKKLLYTAITRAKENVVIISVGDKMRDCLTKKSNFSSRYTNLTNLLTA